MATGLKGRHKVPKAVYDRNTATIDLVAVESREARRKAAAEQVAAEQRALEARMAAEQSVAPATPCQRRPLVYVKAEPERPQTRAWNMHDVIYNLKAGYTPEYVAWRTGYHLEEVRAVADSI